MTLGIWGLGNLGSSLLRGFIRAGTDPSAIVVCDANETTRTNAAREHGVRAVADVRDALADTVFVVLKGYAFDELAPSLDRTTLVGRTFVSCMAGVGFERLRDALGDGVAIVRIMPSLAVAQLDGVIGYTKCAPQLERLLHKLGYAFEVEPDGIERVMAFSACGLGFAAYLIDAFSAAGQSLGFTTEQSDRIAARTFANACERGEDSGGFAGLVAAVATRGGATEQGVLHLDGANVRGAVITAVRRAYERMT